MQRIISLAALALVLASCVNPEKEWARAQEEHGPVLVRPEMAADAKRGRLVVGMSHVEAIVAIKCSDLFWSHTEAKDEDGNRVIRLRGGFPSYVSYTENRKKEERMPWYSPTTAVITMYDYRGRGELTSVDNTETRALRRKKEDAERREREAEWVRRADETRALRRKKEEAERQEREAAEAERRRAERQEREAAEAERRRARDLVRKLEALEREREAAEAERRREARGETIAKYPVVRRGSVVGGVAFYAKYPVVRRGSVVGWEGSIHSGFRTYFRVQESDGVAFYKDVEVGGYGATEWMSFGYLRAENGVVTNVETRDAEIVPPSWWLIWDD